MEMGANAHKIYMVYTHTVEDQIHSIVDIAESGS